jgi:hypothetical protein
MEAAMAEVSKRRAGFQIWYKLYANNVIITVSHQHLEKFLAIIHDVSDDDFNLIIDPKCNTFVVKKHRKIDETMDLKEIPVIQEYTYLGVTMDDSGRLWQTLADSGRLWQTLADSGRLWQTLADSGRLW